MNEFRITDSEAASLRAACEIAVTYWEDVAQKYRDNPVTRGLAQNQAQQHSALLIRLAEEIGV